jgi:hypothetical protein
MKLSQNSLRAVVALTALALFGCSGGSNSPTVPGTPVMQLTQADLQVGGASVAGQTLRPGHAQGQPTFFMAELMMDGAPAPGHEVWVRFERPQGMMGMSQGQFRLYDDGTHGDPTPGDGIYCLLDADTRYGCHGAGMMDGEYHYEFWGQHQAGHESNHEHVRVWLDQN